MTQPSLFAENEVSRGSISGEDPINGHKEVFYAIRNFLAGRFVGATRDEALLNELVKCLFLKVYIEKNPGKAKSVDLDDRDEVRLAAQLRKLFASVRARHPALFNEDEELLLDPTSLCFVLKSLSTVELLDAERDPVGDAFEVFVGANVRGQSGQFFTPRNAVRLLVSAVAPAIGEKVIDPACGAGGFLSATAQYLIAQGATKRQVKLAVEKNIFGIDKDEYLSRLSRTHLGLIADCEPRVVCADSIAWNAAESHSIDDYPVAGEYDVVLTNPPFGTNITAPSGKVLAGYTLARKWKRQKDGSEHVRTDSFQNNVAPQVLFLERCLQLLKPGGRLGIVVPESLISSPRHRYVVEFLRRETTLMMVAGMPENLFKTSGKGGTHTKTCLVVAEKKVRQQAAKAKSASPLIFMAEAQWCGHDSRARAIPYDDLPKIGERYANRGRRKKVESSHLGFLVPEKNIEDQILAPRQYNPEVTRAFDELKPSHHLIPFSDLLNSGVVSLATGDEVGKLAYGTGDIPFVRTSDISNWEIKIDPKQGISEKHYEEYSAKQDVREGDLLMVRDGTYLIGTCALITAFDTRIVYQSHIYKIRVHENELGVTPYLLLAALSSKPVQRQIQSKRVTQDIIDSLGDRIRSLLIPIPKDEGRRTEISRLTKRVIDSRVKSRELARKVREMIVAAN